jgi:SAM-dependent methyltransferase
MGLQNMADSTVANHFNAIAEQWDSRYDTIRSIEDYELVRRKQLALAALDRLVAHPAAAILEIGCGTGRVLGAAQQGHPEWSGIGLDVAAEMIHFCQHKYGDQPALRFMQHDLDTGPVDVQADAILALGVIGYLPRPEQAFEHVAAMLKPGGIFIFTVNKPSLPRLMSRASLRAIYWLKRLSWKPKLNRALPLRSVRGWLVDRFDVLETYDYLYVPYVPVVRRCVFLSKGLERVLGRTPTPLSSTTLFVTRKAG